MLCSHYLSASADVRIYQKPSSERKGDHEVVEGACVTIKIVLSSPLRTLPQSLRDSSLSEGAFEKFAAICLFSPFFMDSEATCCPDALSLQCVGVGAPPYCFVLAVCFIRAIHESPATLFALSFGFAQTNAPSQTSVGEGLAPPARLFAPSFGFNLCSHSTKGSPV